MIGQSIIKNRFRNLIIIASLVLIVGVGSAWGLYFFFQYGWDNKNENSEIAYNPEKMRTQASFYDDRGFEWVTYQNGEKKFYVTPSNSYYPLSMLPEKSKIVLATSEYVLYLLPELPRDINEDILGDVYIKPLDGGEPKLVFDRLPLPENSYYQTDSDPTLIIHESFGNRLLILTSTQLYLYEIEPNLETELIKQVDLVTRFRQPDYWNTIVMAGASGTITSNYEFGQINISENQLVYTKSKEFKCGRVSSTVGGFVPDEDVDKQMCGYGVTFDLSRGTYEEKLERFSMR